MSIAFLALLGWLSVGAQQAGGPALVERVQPRPRLLFAPGEYARIASEISGVRRDAFDRLTQEIDSRGRRAWNERDLQLTSQAFAARVLADRGDGRGATYFDLARNSLRFFLDSHTYRRWSDSHDLVTEGGRWLEAVALAHDWLYPRWTDQERTAIEAWLRDELDHWVDTNRLARASASPFRNDAARGVAALVIASLTLFDVPEHNGAARRALAHAQPFYEAILAAHAHAGLGGGMAEGTFYGNFTAWAQTLVAEALYTGAGVEDAYGRSPFYTARLRYALHASWPGYLTNQFGHDVHQLAPVFGDARRGPTGSALYHRATVLLLGKRMPRTAAAREAYWSVNRQETSRTYTREWALHDVLFWSAEVTPSRPAALSYREPSLGQVFARSDWSDGASWMSFNAGPHLDTHQHYDAGNLTIFRGVDLVVDSGSFDAFGSNHWYNYYARTVAHNTITITDPTERWEGIWGGVPDNLAVNDGGQRTAAPLTPAPTLDEYLGNRVAYDQGRIERYAEGTWGVYIRSDLTNAYQNPKYQSTRPDRSRNRAKVTHVGRDVVYLRGGERRRDAVVVFDRVVSTDASFRKAVLWHAREPFEAGRPGQRVDEGETRYEGASRYDFETDVSFTEGKRQRRSRLFVSALAVDPIIVRQIGRREPTEDADHVTFNTPHRHRHIKDYFVEDPRGILNPQRSTGAPGRPEWPPFNPPETQWLFNDTLVGGWGQTRLEIQPSGARKPDRFLTVLVPSDHGEASAPDIEPARSVDGGATGLAIRQESQTDIVIVGADAMGADITRSAVDFRLAGRLAGDVTIVGLTPDAHYAVRIGGAGLCRIAITKVSSGGLAADEAGVIRARLERLPRAQAGAGALVGGSTAATAAGSSLESGEGGGSDDVGAMGLEASGEQAGSAPAGRHPGLVTINAETPEALAEWEPQVARLLRAGQLRVRETTEDALAPGRTVQRLMQLHRGVPVFGGDISRHLEGRTTVSLFGTFYRDIDSTVTPRMTPADASAAFQKLAGTSLGPSRPPELIVLPTEQGEYVLTYRARLATGDDVVMVFIDADTGETVLRFSDLKRPVM